MPAKRPPARRAPPRAPRAPTPSDQGAHEAIVQYRVLSSGISTPAGAVYRGALVSADELGDADRVTALLDKGSIEEAADDAD